MRTIMALALFAASLQADEIRSLPLDAAPATAIAPDYDLYVEYLPPIVPVAYTVYEGSETWAVWVSDGTVAWLTKAVANHWISAYVFESEAPDSQTPEPGGMLLALAMLCGCAMAVAMVNREDRDK